MHTSTVESDACHHGDGPAGVYGAETSDCDSPFTLINATFDWIAENLRDQIDFVIWTGDSARHDSDEQIPRSPTEVLGTNRWIADKFADLFADPVSRSGGLAIPVVPTFGNNDILPHNILLPGPNKWLQYYTDIWRHFIPEAQRHSFEFGGWFVVEVIPNKLAVFSLNTLYFFDRNAGVDGCAVPSEPGFKQMEWLRVQLQFLRDRGMKAILMGHVPPARTDSKMLWDETCWQKYTLWLKKYRDVVVGGLYGHMNIDHFLLQDTKEIDMELLLPLDEEEEGKEERVSTRVAMEDELSLQSTTDYLQELRDDWSKLPNPSISSEREEDTDEEAEANKKKKKKHRKKLGRWAERYQLTLISPSVVPNYFPTLRVVEYNISGMEDHPVWADAFQPASLPPAAESQRVLDLRDTPDTEAELARKKKQQQRRPPKKHGKKKHGKPKEPNFEMPKAPSKSSPPGPAYSPQPLTLTGYTQFFANLTHINHERSADDIPSENAGTWTDWLLRWQGKPTSPQAAKPRPFRYEVEYSTFDDKVYQLPDLTVNSFVDLAYRIGQEGPGGKAAADLEAESADYEDEEELDAESSDEADSESQGGKKGKKGGKKKEDDKKKKKKNDKANKEWMHFLDRAFVRTVEKKKLKGMA